MLYTYTDYQGSLLALANESGTVVESYAYDPWGKRRNPADWTQSYTRTSFLINRGYTGHEHLDAFGIINMNGRVYDPLTASFFSPDPYIQAPDNWLNYNRYLYAYGNPFKYTDPSGEYVLVDDLLAAVIGGVINVGVNLIQGNVDSFWEGLSYFGAGFVGGWVSIYASPAVGGAVSSSLNSIVSQGFGKSGKWSGGDISWGQVGYSGIVGGLTGQLSSSLGNWMAPTLGKYTADIASPVLQKSVEGAVTGTVSGFTVGTGISLINGDNLETSLKNGGTQALYGFGIGAVTGAGAGMRYARESGLNPWTGKVLSSQQTNVRIVTPDGVVLPEGAIIPDSFIENPNRSGSYGIIDTNGNFQEMLRIDSGTPSGSKGPNESHFHLNGGKKHIFDINRWPWWRNK